jgi:endonuclease/exonuclease/phosphatase family metal-dependent hydrolase
MGAKHLQEGSMAQFKAGDVSFDNQTGEVVRGEHTGVLLPRAFPFMEVFMQRPHEIIPYEELEQVADRNFPEVLTQLRRELADTDRTLFKTYPRRGVKFCPTGIADEHDGLNLLTFNVAGAELLGRGPTSLTESCGLLAKEIADVVREHDPDVLLFQEAAQIRDLNTRRDQDSVRLPPGFHYKFVEAFNSVDYQAPARRDRYREAGWDLDTTCLAQGMGVALKHGWRHASVWNFEPSVNALQTETVRVERGMYAGGRETEPRVYPILHLLTQTGGRPLDIMIVNMHLSTLQQEREGIPEREVEGSRVRLNELEIVTHGIVSRWEKWKRQHAPERGATLWVLGGDLNCTPDSKEMDYLRACRFLDLNINKGCGTKRRKGERAASITVDYLLV